MNRDRWTRIEELFHAALQIDPAERDRFVAEACQGDPPLLDSVRSLLKHDNADEHGFIETPAWELAVRAASLTPESAHLETTNVEGLDALETPPNTRSGTAHQPGTLIAGFKIIRLLGQGGMGEVYLAQDLRLERLVALKRLKLYAGQDSDTDYRLKEARSASLLNHPNIVAVHNVFEFDGDQYIDMEFIDGETLKEVIQRGPLLLEKWFEIGIQICEAVAAAHALSVTHRDLKPANVLINRQGQIKIVDFGLATVSAASLPSTGDSKSPADGSSDRRISGGLSGTIPYMSPEQVQREEITPASDLFSLGTVLYEAVTGVRPFRGKTNLETIEAIAHHSPAPPRQLRPELPAQVDRILLRALSKSKSERYPNVESLSADLRRLQIRHKRIRLWKRIRVPLLAAMVLAAGLIAFQVWRNGQIRQATKDLERVNQLLQEGKFFEAHDLAQSVQRVLPSDSRIDALRPYLFDRISVTSQPAGAQVWLSRIRLAGDQMAPPDWKLLGTTPLEEQSIPRGEYLLKIERQGYASLIRTLSSVLTRAESGLWNPNEKVDLRLVRDGDDRFRAQVDAQATIQLNIRLEPLEIVPKGMVRIPGGTYELVGWSRPVTGPVSLKDFWIDRCEVSNREFKEFVDAGGYQDQSWWRVPIERYDPVDGTLKQISWDEAVALLVDATGKPGPRFWRDQQYSPEQADLPVTGVCWYEAAAYAAFRGKTLPNAFQWEKAARDGQKTVLWLRVMPWGIESSDDFQMRANMGGQSLVSVDSFAEGASPYGCLHMAGNVAEWNWNRYGTGFSVVGGSCSDPAYVFGAIGTYPGLYSSDKIGFRCVLTETDEEPTVSYQPFVEQKIPHSPAVNEPEYQVMKSYYEYDRPTGDPQIAAALQQAQTDRFPEETVQQLQRELERSRQQALLEELDPLITEDIETEFARRQTITFRGTGRGASDSDADRVTAYLWLPKDSSGPFPVVYYKPGSAAYFGLTCRQEAEVVCGKFVHHGRAVFAVALPGMRERPYPPDHKYPAVNTIAYREQVIRNTIEQRLALDYLATRSEVDCSSLVCFGFSQGATHFPFMAVEDRLRGVLLLAAGLNSSTIEVIAEANPVNFAPYVRCPKLILHGRFDEMLPLSTSCQPLFDLMSEPKDLVVIESGHFPAIEDWAPHALRFLDQIQHVSPSSDSGRSEQDAGK